MAAALFLIATELPAQSIQTIVGGEDGDRRPAAITALNSPSAIAFDPSGNLFVADQRNNVIRRFDITRGLVTVYAGTGGAGFGGDGGPATLAALNGPVDLAFDSQGNLYIADAFNNRIRRVDTQQIITTIAGTPGFEPGSAGDGGPATAARLRYPSGIVVARDGTIYVVDAASDLIRKIRNGTITRVAGNGTYGTSPDGTPATDAALKLSRDPADTGGFSASFARSVSVDDSGNVYFLESFGPRLRKISPSGTLTTVIGNGSVGFSGDGGPATLASLNRPSGFLLQGGSLFVSDSLNRRIRRVDLRTGTIQTISGDGTRASTGDGGPASTAQLTYPGGLAVDSTGNLFFADVFGNRIRMISTDGTISTRVGSGFPSYVGDGSPAILAGLQDPVGLTLDRSGNLLITDYQAHRLRKVDRSTSIISTVAGTGIAGYTGDSGPASAAQFNMPGAVAVGPNGDIYVVDAYNQVVRRIDGTGTVSTIAGTGAAGRGADGIAATLSRLSLTFSVNLPRGGVAVDPAGNVYISDTMNDRIRKVSPSGIITTFAGGGAVVGDGGAATQALVPRPSGLALDAAGNLYIAEGNDPNQSLGDRVRKVTPGGVITTFAGNGSALETPTDGVPATQSGMASIDSLAVASSGSVWISDSSTGKVRRVTNSLISKVAGNGVVAYSGDQGPATAASLKPFGIALSDDGTLFIADNAGRRIRVVRPCSSVLAPTSLTSPSPGSTGVATSPRLAWAPDAAAFRYDVYLGTDPSARPLAAADLTATSFSPADLEPLTTYYWRIVAKGDPFCSPALSAESEIRSFTTASTCGPPTRFEGASP